MGTNSCCQVKSYPHTGQIFVRKSTARLFDIENSVCVNSLFRRGVVIRYQSSESQFGRPSYLYRIRDAAINRDE